MRISFNFHCVFYRIILLIAIAIWNWKCWAGCWLATGQSSTGDEIRAVLFAVYMHNVSVICVRSGMNTPGTKSDLPRSFSLSLFESRERWKERKAQRAAEGRCIYECAFACIRLTKFFKGRTARTAEKDGRLKKNTFRMEYIFICIEKAISNAFRRYYYYITMSKASNLKVNSLRKAYWSQWNMLVDVKTAFDSGHGSYIYSSLFCLHRNLEDEYLF